MSIRISVKPHGYTRIVRIDGDLVAEDIGEVDAACGSADAPLVLDLEELRELDSVAVQCLRRWIAGGATVDNAKPYILQRLGLADRSSH